MQLSFSGIDTVNEDVKYCFEALIMCCKKLDRFKVNNKLCHEANINNN